MPFGARTTLDLPPNAVVSYNGYTFPPQSHVRASMTPVKDMAGRTVKYVLITIDVQTTITAKDPDPLKGAAPPHDSAQPPLNSIRKMLSQARGELKVNGLGFGLTDDDEFHVNGTSKVKDIAYGPSPVRIDWTPIGFNQAAQIHWVITVTVPECDCAGLSCIKYENSVLEMSYEVSFDIDESGHTNRLITGALEISSNSDAGNTNIRYVADNFRERVARTFPVPLGFKRKQQYSVSRDKRILNFSINDTEIPSPNAYPVGVIKITAPQTVTSQLTGEGGIMSAAGFRTWACSQTVTIEYSPKFTAVAMLGFARELILQRIIRAEGRGGPLAGDGEYSVNRIITRIGLREDPFERRVSVSVDWWMRAEPLTVIEASGLGLPPFVGGELGSDDFGPETGWRLWAEFNERTGINGPRGIQHMEVKKEDDEIIDVCHTPGSRSVISSYAYGVEPGIVPTIADSPLTPESSWIDCQGHLSTLRLSGNVTHSPAYGGSNQQQPSASGSATSGTYSATPGRRPRGDDPKDITYNRTTDSYEITFSGTARRIGFHIPIPVITKIGGKDVRPTYSRDFHRKVGEALNGAPLYLAGWRQTYRVDELPQGDLWDSITLSPADMKAVCQIT